MHSIIRYDNFKGRVIEIVTTGCSKYMKKAWNIKVFHRFYVLNKLNLGIDSLQSKIEMMSPYDSSVF